ncbi:MAG: hypothetical protein GY826_30885 [Fuerstiella sp.]|nr:hypothetical protein [Fuerstiella sp.]MDG2130161.1 hypothetical protein [Fuerstiella sp.]
MFLPDVEWYRCDPRDNRDGVDAQVTPPFERLAFPTSLQQECDLPGIHLKPSPK